MHLHPWLLKLLVIALCLAGWFWTQALLERRGFPDGVLGDRIHDLTAGLNQRLHDSPRAANALLIVTSGLIDLVGLFLLGLTLFGPSVGPFLGLMILFALRQACQGLCALPPPEGMIWRHPGFPSLLVTYGTSTDLFFSGHTAIAVFGSLELAHHLGHAGVLLGLGLALTEAATVLVLRAHYTMDVLAGALAALWVWSFLPALTPHADALLAAVAGR